MDTRTITHADHTDTETLFCEVWAVTACDCELVTKGRFMMSYKDVILTLCITCENGWTHEDALYTAEIRGIDGDSFIQAIRHEATSIDGILRETNGNYTLRSK